MKEGKEKTYKFDKKEAEWRVWEKKIPKFWLEQLAHYFIESSEQLYKVIPTFYMKKLKFRQVK